MTLAELAAARRTHKAFGSEPVPVGRAAREPAPRERDPVDTYISFLD